MGESPPPDYASLLLTRVPQRPGPHQRRARTNLAHVVRDLAPAERLVGVLVEMALDPTQDPRIRIAAVDRLLDRGFGRPAQTLHVEASISAGDGLDELDAALEDVSDAELVEAVEAASMLRGTLLARPTEG